MKKIVIVGFGFMGMNHARNVIKNENVKLVAVVDKNTSDISEKLNQQSGNFTVESVTAGALEGINLYDDFGNCLLTEKPDICIIAVHTNLHYEFAKTALEAGVHVFVEKPFCLDVVQGQALIDLAAFKERTLMVGHVVRFMPAWQELKELIDSQKYGLLEFLSLSRFSGIPSWGQWKDNLHHFGSTGGALFDLVVHDIDFAQWACGIPDEIKATYLSGKLSNHDYVSTFWNYKNKQLQVKIEGGNTFHGQYPFQASFSARFQNASIFYSSLTPAHIHIATDIETINLPVEDANEGFARELNYFIECVVDHKSPDLCHPSSALNTIDICYRHLAELQPA